MRFLERFWPWSALARARLDVANANRGKDAVLARLHQAKYDFDCKCRDFINATASLVQSADLTHVLRNPEDWRRVVIPVPPKALVVYSEPVPAFEPLESHSLVLREVGIKMCLNADLVSNERLLAAIIICEMVKHAPEAARICSGTVHCEEHGEKNGLVKR